MLKLPEIINFQLTEKILHKRSIYKNLYPSNNINNPRKIEDVKITLHHDLSDKWLQEDWLSVYDNMINNNKEYPKLNAFITKLFSNKSKYEV
jgi:hypothetical protein